MFDVIMTLSASQMVAIGTTLLSVVSLSLAVVFYLQGRRYKRPRVVLKSINLFNEDSKKIKGLKTM